MELEKIQQAWQTQEAAAPLPPQLNSLKSKLQLFDFEQGKNSSIAGTVVLLSFGLLLGVLGFIKGNLIFGSIGIISLMRGVQLGIQARLASHLPDPAIAPRAYLEAQLRLVNQVIRAQKVMIIPGVIYAGILVYEVLREGPLSLEDLLVSGAFALIALMLAGVLVWWFRTQHPYVPAKLKVELEEMLAEWEAE